MDSRTGSLVTSTGRDTNMSRRIMGLGQQIIDYSMDYLRISGTLLSTYCKNSQSEIYRLALGTMLAGRVFRKAFR